MRPENISKWYGVVGGILGGNNRNPGRGKMDDEQLTESIVNDFLAPFDAKLAELKRVAGVKDTKPERAEREESTWTPQQLIR